MLSGMKYGRELLPMYNTDYKPRKLGQFFITMRVDLSMRYSNYFEFIRIFQIQFTQRDLKRKMEFIYLVIQNKKSLLKEKKWDTNKIRIFKKNKKKLKKNSQLTLILIYDNRYIKNCKKKSDPVSIEIFKIEKKTIIIDIEKFYFHKREFEKPENILFLKINGFSEKLIGYYKKKIIHNNYILTIDTRGTCLTTVIEQLYFSKKIKKELFYSIN